MKTLLLCLMTLVCFAADLPKPALLAIDKTQAAIDKIQADVNAKCNKERESLILALGKLQDSATKASDLEGALALRKKIDEIRADIKAASEPEKPAAWWLQVTTVEQWTAIEGKEFVVPATAAEFDTQIKVPAGKGMVILVRPGDTWATGAAWQPVGPAGDSSVAVSNAPIKTMPLMAMVAVLESKMQQVSSNPVVVGPARIRIKANDGTPADNVGEMHIKIVSVEK